MAVTDIRRTVLEIVNEVRRKLGIPNAATSLTVDSQTPTMVDYLNDVMNVINDFGMWNEMLGTASTVLVDGQQDYSVNTTDAVKTIKDIYSGSNNAAMTFITNEEMRLLKRTSVSGQPRMFTIFGVDSVGNPKIRVYPTPNSQYAGQNLDIFYQKMPKLYTTSDASDIPPFPARMIIQGLYARMILDEEGGSQSDHYTKEQEKFQSMVQETFNRFKADIGYFRRFVPSRRWST